MTDVGTYAEAVASGSVSELRLFDIFDDEELKSAISALGVPRPIEEVEALEAWIKKSWAGSAADFSDARVRARFAEFFLRLGVLPKYKSYGVKYAAPFGYSLFDLQDNGGFSIQLHESAKVEAFHILNVHPQAFVLLCTVDEWEKRGSEMIELWASGRPEDSPLAYRPLAGDVAVIEDLSTVHTVVGCLVEEFATSSYDVVSRLYDQNEGTPVTLPAAHSRLSEVLGAATAIAPQRRVHRHGEWEAAVIESGTSHIANLPDMGLVGTHVVLSSSSPTLSETVRQENVTTVFLLSGRIELDVEGMTFEMGAGDVTALAPGTHFTVTKKDTETHLSLCEVSTKFAFADLR